MKICCMGSGYFSCAIAKILSNNEKNEISIWTHDQKYYEKCSKKGSLLLDKKEIALNNIKIINDLDLLKEYDVIFILVSSRYIMDVINSIKKIITKKQAIIIGTKGLISIKPYNITSYAKKSLKTNKIGYIAGPNLADDLLNNAPFSMCIASNNQKVISLAKYLFKDVMLETSNNMIATEVGSILKNIYAIGSGMIYDMYPYPSTLYSYTAASYQEYLKILTNYFKYKQSKPIKSLIGDFMMTTNREESRNFKFGTKLNKSQKDAKDYLKTNTVEGYDNIDFMRELIHNEIDKYPILYAIYRIIYKNQKTDILIDICKKNY